MRTCDAAVAVLRETGNPAVMATDDGLIQEIAARAGLKRHEGRGQVIRIEQNVLGNLTRQHEGLVAGHTTGVRGRRVRCFWLPEHAPERYRKACDSARAARFCGPRGTRELTATRRGGDEGPRAAPVGAHQPHPRPGVQPEPRRGGGRPGVPD